MASEEDRPRGEAPPIGEVPDEDEHEEAEHEEHQPSVEEQAEIEDAAEDLLLEAHRTYLAAVLDHFGPEAPVHPCPTCQTRGYTVVAVQPDPEAERCESCAGVGIVATGSLVEGNETRPCPSCNGAGFRRKPSELPEIPELPVGPVEPLPAEAFPFVPVEPLPLGESAA